MVFFKKIFKVCLLSMLVCLPVGCNETNRATKTETLASTIDHYMEEQLALHEIPGAAVGVIKKGQILYKQYYGLASPVHAVPLAEEHLFRVYSTTKLLVSTAIFQLIERKQLHLEDLVNTYVSIPDSWQSVQIQHLLTHSSGIPDFIYLDAELSNEAIWSQLIVKDLEFKPGSQWRYNQTNYWLLAQIIEKISGQTLQEFIWEQQFSNRKEGVLFSSNSLEVIPHRISKFIYHPEVKNYYLSTDNAGSRGFAGNGLNISLEKLLEWNLLLDRHELISEDIKLKMWSPFNFSDHGPAFLHGWASYGSGKFKSVGFSGGGVSAVRKFPSEDLTIVIMTNGYRYKPVHEYLVNSIAKMVQSDLEDPQKTFQEQTLNNFLKLDFEKALEAYERTGQDHPTLTNEFDLNSLGYVFLGQESYDKALKLFRANVQKYPQSANVYDSLGEAYFVNGDLDLAMENYKKALVLDPTSENAKHLISIITKQRERKIE